MQLSEQFIDVLADDALLPPFWLLHLQHPKHDNPSAISLYLFLFLHDGIKGDHFHRLLLCLHDIGQLGIARRVQPQIRRQHGRKGQGECPRPVLHFLLHRKLFVRKQARDNRRRRLVKLERRDARRLRPVEQSRESGSRLSVVAVNALLPKKNEIRLLLSAKLCNSHHVPWTRHIGGL